MDVVVVVTVIIVVVTAVDRANRFCPCLRPYCCRSAMADEGGLRKIWT
jgi:hypothetical protein